MNKIILMGRLTHNPEIRYTQSATPTAVARFSIAVNRKFKREGQPDADFFNCTAFGKTAEFVEKYLQTGTKVLLSGQLQNNNYTKQSGEKVYSVQVIVEEIEFAESKNASGNADGQPPAQPAVGDGFTQIDADIESDLPF